MIPEAINTNFVNTVINTLTGLFHDFNSYSMKYLQLLSYGVCENRGL